MIQIDWNQVATNVISASISAVVIYYLIQYHRRKKRK